jgi:hypothetical protein
MTSFDNGSFSYVVDVQNTVSAHSRDLRQKSRVLSRRSVILPRIFFEKAEVADHKSPNTLRQTIYAGKLLLFDNDYRGRRTQYAEGT